MTSLLDTIVHSPSESAVHGTTARIKAFAWARVSTDMQEEKGLSMPEQLREIETYSERNGIEIVAQFSEAASAFQKKSRRVEFERMLEMARAERDITAIVVHDLSRFSRDSVEAQVLLRDLSQSGIEVISVTDPAIDRESVAGVYMQHILLAKNEAYSREIAFHTRKGCRSNIQTRDEDTGWCYKNGGQPLWGYKIQHLERGVIKKGRPLIKSIWVPDDTEVAGKPIREWARHCLLELAARGASLDELRDFCNSNGIPAPRQQYWGSTTWHSLLHPNALLQYAGYGVWNVRGKHQRMNPASEWVIVPKAHEALITEEEAQAILSSRKGRVCKNLNGTSNRSQSSPYLLSGGMFTCGRCGSNLMGMRKTKAASYYICGSQPHRKGLGCGTAVYVPQMDMEQDVLIGLKGLLGVISDQNGFIREANEELRQIWEESHGYDPMIRDRIEDIDSKLANIRAAIENGVPDAQWAYTRMQELLEEKERLSGQVDLTSEPPKLDAAAIIALKLQTEETLENGSDAEKKRILRAWVDKIELAPERLEVEINYRIPEPLVNSMGAGAYSETYNKLVDGTETVRFLYYPGTCKRPPKLLAARQPITAR